MSLGEETGYPKELGSREPGDGMEDSNKNQSQNSGQFVQPTKTAIEHSEELKLKQKYPGLKTGGGAGSAMLQKRLHKGGPKYFDSGDYMMARAKLKGQKNPMKPSSEEMLLQESIGDTIPTPENLPVRKPSLVSKLASGTLTS